VKDLSKYVGTLCQVLVRETLDIMLQKSFRKVFQGEFKINTENKYRTCPTHFDVFHMHTNLTMDTTLSYLHSVFPTQ